MAAEGEPTEEPTPQRLLKARQEGQVAVSRDFAAALAFIVLIAVLAGSAPVALARMVMFFRQSLSAASAGGAGEFSAALSAAGARTGQVVVPALALPLGATLVVAILVGTLQTGGLFAWKSARPDFKRLSPMAGLKRLFGVRTVVETAKSLLKVTVVLLVAAASLLGAAEGLLRLAGARPGTTLAALGFFTRQLTIRAALLLVAWGLIDWLLVRRRHRRSLMMTREQVKREYKESEGDPHHRSERQRLHRELSEQRMVEDVRRADFVVVNPEHIAVAIKYDRDSEAAPQVVAKGERLAAERIKQVAREAGVPIYRDVGLARALNELPEGDEIPEALYEAVAELLRVLWEIDTGAPPPEPTQARIAAGGAPMTPARDDANSSSHRAGDVAQGALGQGAATDAPRSAPGTWKRV